MKQKLALACTLIHTPELLVLDEPTTGVDPVSRRDFWRILARLQREGLTLLLTTPYLDEAERCQRVALMDRGRILSSAPPTRCARKRAGAVVEILAEPEREAAEILGRAARGRPRSSPSASACTRPSRVSRTGDAAGAVGRIREALARRGIVVEPRAGHSPDSRGRVHRPHACRRGGRHARRSTDDARVHAPPSSWSCAPRPWPPRRSAAVTRLTLAEALGSRARPLGAPRRARRALETAAAAGLKEAKAGRLPQIDVAAGYALLSNVPELSVFVPGPPPSRQTVFPNIPNTYRAHAGLTQCPLHRRPRRRAEWRPPTHQRRPRRRATWRRPCRTSSSRPRRPTGPW